MRGRPVLFLGVVLAEAHPVGGDIAGVTHRQAQPVRGSAQGIANLEGSRLLALQAVGVERVDQGDRLPLGDLDHQRQGVVERAVHLDNPGAVGHRARQLASRHLALRDEHNRSHPRPGGVRRSRGGGVAGGGADHRLHVPPGGLADGGGHAAVLERAAGVQPFVFGEQLATQFRREARQRDEGRIPLQQGDRPGMGGQVEQGAVALQNTGIGHGRQKSWTKL